MLWTILAVLLVLWVLGLATSYTMGGFIHLLLVLAVVVILFRVLRGGRGIA
ncbi:MAG: lmo0937 family membrane protein [Acidobacteria bacterium]|nr:lmo0937 family membrane protein [Acidobacteriota bacterium]